jgi:hypothetical protein
MSDLLKEYRRFATFRKLCNGIEAHFIKHHLSKLEDKFEFTKAASERIVYEQLGFYE